MKNIVLSFYVVAIALGLHGCQSGQPDPRLEATVDVIVKPYIDSSKIAGIAIGVFREHKLLLLKSYGYADLEWNAVLPIDASFEIGSITKQFTAAAILQMVEQGKISLDDDMTKYIQFDTHGRKVTVRNLLSHTSGIKSFTDLPMFPKLRTEKHNRDTILRIVEKEPWNFEPGDELMYNNSGFFILGLIIEKISGMKYEDYVRKYLFDKAGMQNSYYASGNRIVRNRAHGYDKTDSSLVRTVYLDPTWFFAAGSFCSTVEDLEKWNDALHHGKIISQGMYRELITPAKLNNGEETRYAKGITVTEWKQKRVLSHIGSIYGFAAQNNYFPDDDVSIIVLINSFGVDPGNIAGMIADYLFKLRPESRQPFKGNLQGLTGTFEGNGYGEQMKVTIARNDTTLTVQFNDNKESMPLWYLKDKTWTDGSALYILPDTIDRPDELQIDQIYGYLKLNRK